MYLGGLKWGDTGYIDPALHKDEWRVLVITVMYLRVPLYVWKFSNSLVAVGFLRRPQLRGVREQGNRTCPSHGLP
jgi:hypothetical protein